MNTQSQGNWVSRLGPTARTILIVAAVIFGMLAIGMVAGFSYAIFEDGTLPTKPAVWLIFAAMVGLVAAAGWILQSLYRSMDHQRTSRFERRYWKMWAVMAGLGLPLGIGIAMLGLQEDASFDTMVLSNSPITPLTAILASVLLGAVLIVSIVIYFRAIDDHEKNAYLWGSNVAFHFVAIAFPLYWLLARGSLVPTLTIGIALLIVLLSCIVQAIVWALFKFR